MSFREQMQAEVDRLTAAHEENRKAYRKALADRDAATKTLRELNDKASASANELGAAKKALEELDRNAPAVEASGEVGG